MEVVSVSDYKVHSCLGCNACFQREDLSCCQKDDMQKIYLKLAAADMLVIASKGDIKHTNALLQAHQLGEGI